MVSFLLLRKWKYDNATTLLLVGFSLVFYAYWDWRLVWVIIVSIGGNYVFGRVLQNPLVTGKRAQIFFGCGVALNLLLLGYFKYYNFFVENLNAALGSDIRYLDVILPLGVSFFTFQQIAYLFDSKEGKVEEHNFLSYALFVSFFPQLIAGPIVHHKEMMPQYVRGLHKAFNLENFSLGIAIFIVGMLKKVLIADHMGIYVTPTFDAVSDGQVLTFIQAWAAALSYTFQLYFDFSAYSDMAIGLGLMFGVRFPVNFNSPYKARDIIEFWQRWHITLSNFLRDYLYIPLGGNRHGLLRRDVNIAIVMLIGGLWHGANWTFVVWGGLHGVAILINHHWRKVRPAHWQDKVLAQWGGRLLTFVFVVLCWVFFRAHSVEDGFSIVVSMFGMNGVDIPIGYKQYIGAFAPFLTSLGVTFSEPYLFQGTSQVLAILAALWVCWFMPNTLQWSGYVKNEEKRNAWVRAISLRPQYSWSVVLGIAFVIGFVNMFDVGEFLYFQF